MGSQIVLPVFPYGHPLKYDTRLKALDFRSILWGCNKTLKRRKRTVIILMSLFDLNDYLEVANNIGVKKTRIVIFSSKEEIKFFKKYSSLFEIKKKKDLQTFIPKIVKVDRIKRLDLVNSTKEIIDPVQELKTNIDLVRTFYDGKDKGLKRVKRYTKTRTK